MTSIMPASPKRFHGIRSELLPGERTFNVNMPMLYGDGERAFIKLQEEIMKISDDPTKFAWTPTENHGGGLFAPSPALFSNSSQIVRRRARFGLKGKNETTTFATTNEGFLFKLPMKPIIQCGTSARGLLWLGVLDWVDFGSMESLPIGIRFMSWDDDGPYAREGYTGLHLVGWTEISGIEFKSILVRPDYRRK